MKILVVDTENTGLWNKRAAISHPSQPDLAQIAVSILFLNIESTEDPCPHCSSLGLVIDRARCRACGGTGSILHDPQVLNEYSALVKPSSFCGQPWVMSEGALAVHGLTEERCEAEGVPLVEALRHLYKMSLDADLAVAFNQEYDKNVLHRALWRVHGKLPTPPRRTQDGKKIPGISVPWRRGLRWWCPMTALTGVMKLPFPNPRWRPRPNAPPHKRYKFPKLEEAFKFCTGREPPENAHDAAVDVGMTIEVVKWCHEKGMLPK